MLKSMPVEEFKRFLRGIVRVPQGEAYRLEKELDRSGRDTVQVEATGLPRKDEVHSNVRILALTYRWSLKEQAYLAYVLGHKVGHSERIVVPWRHLVRGNK